MPWRAAESHLGFRNYCLGSCLLVLACAGSSVQPAESAPSRPRASSDASAQHAESLSVASIQDVMRQHRVQIRACYEKREARGEFPRGRLVLGWTIGVDGGVNSLHVVSSSLSHPELGHCLSALVQRLRFPAPRQPTPIKYPFEIRDVRR